MPIHVPPGGVPPCGASKRELEQNGYGIGAPKSLQIGAFCKFGTIQPYWRCRSGDAETAPKGTGPSKVPAD